MGVHRATVGAHSLGLWVQDQAGAEIGTGTASVSRGFVHLFSVEVTLN